MYSHVCTLMIDVLSWYCHRQNNGIHYVLVQCETLYYYYLFYFYFIYLFIMITQDNKHVKVRSMAEELS